MQQVVLVVEDDEDLRYVVRTELVTRFGVAVVEAGDGQQALDAVSGGLRPDVVISDFKMPKMDGFALARALHKIGFRRPVVFMTGLRPEQLVREAFDLGGFDFVSKPLGEEFFEAVGNALALAKLNWEVNPSRVSASAETVESVETDAAIPRQDSKNKAS